MEPMTVPGSGAGDGQRDDLAPRQTGPHTWRADDVDDPADWTWTLSPTEIDELTSASAPYSGASPAQLRQLTMDGFHLPRLAANLVGLRERLTHGRGFELLRGFPTGQLTELQSAAAFVGLGLHLGSARSQNAAGDLLGNVRDAGADAADPDVRIYQTAERQTFHTDSADVVGLMCLAPAASGGESLLVSASAIYNEMLESDEDLAAVLFEPIATDRRGEVPAGADPFFAIPVLNWYLGSLTVVYQRQYIESAQRFEGAPRLTPQTIKALNLFDEIANDPSMHLRMSLRPGDMQFVHNHSVLHDRTGFTDMPGSSRHLLRLWLSVPDDRALPPVFAQRFGTTTVGDRGGIPASGF